MTEKKNLEFKESVTNTFLKSVSAFANNGGGEICFGIDDNGNVKGLEHVDQARLDIENRINDSIHPKPSYYLIPHYENQTLSLIVEESMNKPYLYRGKAYCRNDTASVEVDDLELRRLTLAGMNLTFDQLVSAEQNLEFSELEKELKKTADIETVSLDVLKSLNLYRNGKFNNAAALVSDHNEFPGIDIIRFGNSIDIMKERKTVNGISVLKEYQEAVEFFERYYTEDVIQGFERTRRELIPEKAFREAIVNALAHRNWDIPANVTVSMYEDRIVIVSAGGLPAGITEEEYLRGGISLSRNPILTSLLFRLNYIEAFGTGILRIRSAYQNSVRKPVFEMTDHSIRITLPLLRNVNQVLNETEQKLIEVLSSSMLSSTEIAMKLGMEKTKVIRILNRLVESGVLVKTGNARATKYRIS